MKKLKLIILPILTILSIIPLLAFADAISDARQSALDFGTTYKDSATSAITAQNKSNTPGYTTDNPEQTKYYNGTSTDADAQAKIQSSSEGDLMSNGIANRPKMTINPNDSFLNTGKAIEGNPDQVVAMLTGTYGECKPLTLTKTETELRTCDQYAEPNCIDGSKVVTVSGAETSFNYPFITASIPYQGGSGCAQHHLYTTIEITNLASINSLYLTNLGWDDSVKVTINGSVVYTNGSFTGFRGGCERSTAFWIAPNIDLKPYLVQGTNTIDLLVGISGSGFVSATYRIDYPKDRICSTVDTCVNIPSNCSFQSSKCLNFSAENICNYTQNLYSCATTTTTSTANVTCGSNVYCTNEQCTKVEADSDTKDFVKSVSYLQALNQMGKDSEISADNVTIFTGTKFLRQRQHQLQ